MDLLCKLELTAAGRPVFLENEVEVKIESDTSLLEQHNKKIISKVIDSCTIRLTNYRIIFQISKAIANEGFYLFLKDIRFIEDCAGLFSRSTRIAINLLTSTKQFGIKFSDSGKDDFLRLSCEYLMKKSWLTMPIAVIKNNLTIIEPSIYPVQPKFSSTSAGIGGIIKRQEKSIESVDNLRKIALSDLNSLMKSASNVVVMIQKYSKIIEDKKSNMSETESLTNELNEFDELLHNMGMTSISPVTKVSAGKLFHEQLARQIVDMLFINNSLSKLGGIITLTDLYCIVNRLRGTELVSPEDLYLSCKEIDKLNLGLHFKSFSSGFNVLQLQSLSDTTIFTQILDIFQSNSIYQKNGINSTELSFNLTLSVVICKEILLQAELLGKLCRDESSNGLCFFPNLFV